MEAENMSLFRPQAPICCGWQTKDLIWPSVAVSWPHNGLSLYAVNWALRPNKRNTLATVARPRRLSQPGLTFLSLTWLFEVCLGGLMVSERATVTIAVPLGPGWDTHAHTHTCAHAHTSPMETYRHTLLSWLMANDCFPPLSSTTRFLCKSRFFEGAAGKIHELLLECHLLKMAQPSVSY